MMVVYVEGETIQKEFREKRAGRYSEGRRRGVPALGCNWLPMGVYTRDMAVFILGTRDKDV